MLQYKEQNPQNEETFTNGNGAPTIEKALWKRHSGQQTTVTTSPTNFASFTDSPQEMPPKTFLFGDVMLQIIPPENSFTFNKKTDQICQTDDLPEKCQAKAMEDEDIPLLRKNLRKTLDVDFLAVATKRDRNLNLSST